MKLLSLFLLGLLTTGKLHSQNCVALDKKPFTRSIKFGGKVPAELMACSKASTAYPYNNSLRVVQDSLTTSCRKKYADLFNLFSVPFTFSQLTTNKNGGLYVVEWYSFFDDKNPANATTYSPPADFTKLYKQFTLLYGPPVRIEEATTTDPLFVKDIGMPRLMAW
ncbi:MAG TPA: hypothetical protein VD794_12630, partial [Flavisolibacter sp.]|nr:hypothetical protein [Flavisolibacter sp.]